jgi:hypothetical protein
MICVGFLISNKIADHIADTNAIYYTAAKIDNNADQFNYGIKTNIGNALVYGTLSTIDPVSMDTLTGEYMYIEKVYERYSMHTRVVTHRSANGTTYTTTETYYTWDTCKREEKSATTVAFLDREFSINLFSLGWSNTLILNQETLSGNILNKVSNNYVYEDGDFWSSVGDIRYHYNVIPVTKTGSILVRLGDNTITPINGNKISIEDGTPTEIIQHLQDSEGIPCIIFWVIWSIIIIILVVVYVAHDNNWLEIKRKR